MQQVATGEQRSPEKAEGALLDHRGLTNTRTPVSRPQVLALWQALSQHL
jgi:hypothetical protein